MTYLIIVDGKPFSDNHIYLQHGHIRFMRKEAKDYKKKVQQGLNEAPITKFEGPVRVTVRHFFKDNRKRDAHNFGKLICDSMIGPVYNDDSQIDTITYKKQCGCGTASQSHIVISDKLNEESPAIDNTILIKGDDTNNEEEKEWQEKKSEPVNTLVPGLSLAVALEERRLSQDIKRKEKKK